MFATHSNYQQLGQHNYFDWNKDLGQLSIISPSFPRPGQNQSETLAVQDGKLSPPFIKPARRLFGEPDYSDPQQVETVLSQLIQFILNNFSPAFATSLDPTKVANVELVKINMKHVPPA